MIQAPDEMFHRWQLLTGWNSPGWIFALENFFFARKVPDY
jgi:hypothetical protein